MLDNDPPPGTAVIFLQDIKSITREVKAYSTGTLIRALQKYVSDNPDDKFEVEYMGERVIVSRRQIQRARR
jgi:transcriptional regulator GlxA family with amidase domain